jgi:acyl carrier protein
MNSPLQTYATSKLLRSRAQIRAGVSATLAGVLRIAPGEIDVNRPIRELPNADSAALLESIVALEEHFDVIFPDELLFRLETAADIARVIEALDQVATTNGIASNAA